MTEVCAAPPSILMRCLRPSAAFVWRPKVKVPGPMPLAGRPVIQLAVVAAVHAHPAVVFTMTAGPGPPALPKFRLVGFTEYAHDDACVIVTVCPATVSVPTRCPPLFAA